MAADMGLCEARPLHDTRAENGGNLVFVQEINDILNALQPFFWLASRSDTYSSPCVFAQHLKCFSHPRDTIRIMESMQSSSQGVPVRADEDLWMSPTCASSVPQTKAPKMKSTTYPIRSDVLFAEISPAMFVAESRVMQNLNEQTMAKGRQGQIRTVSNSGEGHGDDVARNDITACGIQV